MILMKHLDIENFAAFVVKLMTSKMKLKMIWIMIMSDEYKQGYRDGFKDGYETATKGTSQKEVPSVCSVCQKDMSLTATFFVCPFDMCPKKTSTVLLRETS